MIKHMEKELTPMLTALTMKENGLMINKMGTAKRVGQMVHDMRECIARGENMGMVF